MIVELVLFILLSIVAVSAAIAVITAKNSVYAVVFLVTNFFAIAMFYLILAAQFIAFLQILVYAGAIMVLFLFVVMILNLTGAIEDVQDKLPKQKWIALLLGAVLLVEAGIFIATGAFAGARVPKQLPGDFGTVAPVGRTLFFYYLLPFEATSVLLLIAMVGTIVLAARRTD